jgi:hypothetical protein
LRNAIGGAFGPVGGAKGVVDKDVAQRGHLFCQLGVVLLLPLVDAAVLQQNDLAGRNTDAIDPVRHQGYGPPQQLRQARGYRRQGVFRLELPFGWPPQMGGDHHGRSRVQRHLDARNRSANAGVFGDAARIILRHIQVSSDKDALALGFALGAQIGKSQDVHAATSATRTISRHLLE